MSDLRIRTSDESKGTDEVAGKPAIRFAEELEWGKKPLSSDDRGKEKPSDEKGKDIPLLPKTPRRAEPLELELPPPFPAGDRFETKTRSEVAIERRNLLLSEQSKDGERRVATVKVDGREVTAEAVRTAGKIQEFRLFGPEGNESARIVRDSATGQLKLDGKPDADAMKTLTRLGVKIDKDGKIQGEIELTAKGELRYTDNPGSPKRVVSHLNPDGSSTRTDLGRYVKTEYNASGAETGLKAWMGRTWAAVKKEDISEKVSPDGKTTSTTAVFRKPDGSIEKSVSRIVGTADGDERSLATFTHARGLKRTYDWTNAIRRDDATGKVSGKDAFGSYSEKRENWGRTLPDGGKEYRKDGCTVAKDKEHRVTSISTADSSTAPGKRLDVSYDVHGDVKSVKIGGKTYERVGPEANPGLTFHLGRGEQESAFRSSTKFNKWVYKEDGTAKTFNIGVTEGGKIMISSPGKGVTEFDVSRGSTRDKTTTLSALERELTTKRTESPERLPLPTPEEAHLHSGLGKLRASLDARSKLDEIVAKLSKEERAAMYKALEPIARSDIRMTSAQETTLARRGLQQMLFASFPNPLDAISRTEAQAVRHLLRRVGAVRK